MPNIRTFDAGPGELQPSDKGSAAFRELGAVQERNALQAERLLTQTGRQIGRGISEIGQSIGNIEEKAQQHTDALAEIDFQNGLTSSEIAAIGTIGKAATPTDENGQPINDHVGAGGNTSLPPTANVPSPGQYAQVASNVTERHSGILGGLLDSLPGMGVSQKAQDRMAAQAAASQRRLAVHAAARDGELATTYAVHSLDTQVNQSTAAVGRGDVPLDVGLAQLDDTFNSAKQLGTGEVGAKLEQHIIAQREKARFNMIKESMEADVNSGQLNKAMDKLKQYDPDIGGRREELRTHLQGLENQRLSVQNRAQAQQDRQDAIDRDKFVGDLYEKNKLLPSDPNYVKDPLAEIEKKYQGDDKIKARTEYQQLVNGPNIKETNISRETFSDLAKRVNLPYGDPNKITDIGPIIDARSKKPGEPGSLNRADANELQQMITQAKTPEGDRLNQDTEHFLTGFKPQIDKSNPLMPSLDPTGPQHFYDFRMAVRDKQAQLLRNHDDPRKAITPGNPDYMGSPDNLRRFQTTLQQSTTNARSRLAPGATSAPAASGPPTGTPAAKVPNVLKSPSTGLWKDPATNQIFGTDGYPKEMNFTGEPATTTTPAQDAISNALKNPGATKMNYAPEGGGLTQEDITPPAHTPSDAATSKFPLAEAKQASLTAGPGEVKAVTDQAQRTQTVQGYGRQLTGAIVINGHSYRFINGGGGRGSIPFGTYSVNNFRTAEQREAQGLNNLGDTFDLSNVSDPLAGGTRSDLRIHAAHGQGTLGCIGILGGPQAFKQFAEDMKAANVTKLTLGPQTQIAGK